MQRRLIKQGSSTLMVSLPSSWLKKYSLKKGDAIELLENEEGVLISASLKKNRKETSVQLTGMAESSVRTAVVNAYRSGYDVIHVSFQSEEQFKVLKDVVKHYLLGFEIMQKNKDFCVIESVSEPKDEQFEFILKKIFYIISGFIELTRDRLAGKVADDYRETAFKLHQYDNYCRRVLAKRNLGNEKMGLYWSFLTLMTHGQRELYHLHRYLDKNPVQVEKFELMGKLEEVFALLFEGYSRKDFGKFERIHELEKEAIYNGFYKILNGDRRKNIVAHHLASSLREFYLASSPLMGLLLEGK